MKMPELSKSCQYLDESSTISTLRASICVVIYNSTRLIENTAGKYKKGIVLEGFDLAPLPASNGYPAQIFYQFYIARIFDIIGYDELFCNL